MNRALTFALVVLVGASAALNVILFRRQKEIEQRLVELEKKPAPAATAKTPADPEIRTFTEPTKTERRYTDPGTTGDPKVIERTGDRVGDTSTATLPADVRAAIAKEVEEQLKKSGAGSVHMSIDPFQDPMTVMEKELALSPSQKIRIQELLKRKQDENMAVMDSDLKMKEKMDKHQEIDRRYEELIKRELDTEQQKKYEELVKSGQLMTGTVIKFGVKKDDK